MNTWLERPSPNSIFISAQTDGHWIHFLDTPVRLVIGCILAVQCGAASSAVPCRFSAIPRLSNDMTQYRKQLLLTFLVAPRLTSQSLFDCVARMARLSCQFADVLAVNPMGRPDVFVLIHFEQLPTSALNVQKFNILIESALLRVVNFR
jgi:hypothetical protein